MRNAQQRGALCAHGELRNCLYQWQFRARRRHFSLVPPRGAPQGRWECLPCARVSGVLCAPPQCGVRAPRTKKSPFQRRFHARRRRFPLAPPRRGLPQARRWGCKCSGRQAQTTLPSLRDTLPYSGRAVFFSAPLIPEGEGDPLTGVRKNFFFSSDKGYNLRPRLKFCRGLQAYPRRAGLAPKDTAPRWAV